MTDLIVAGFDGSPTARHAVDWAAAEAELRHGELLILAAHDAANPADADLYAERLRIATARPSLVISTRAVRGAPQHVLRRAGATAALVVVGSVGRAPVKPRDLGATARSVAMRCPAAVVVVPPNASRSLSRVVAGVDGSMRDIDVLDAATRMATTHGAELLVVHSVLGSSNPQDRARVADIAARAARSHTSVAVSTQVDDGDPVNALRRAVGDDGLIVVGRHRTRAITVALFHSSSDALVRNPTVPVMVVEQVASSR